MGVRGSTKGGVTLKRNLYAGKSQSGGLGLKFFTDEELEEIHFATLEILEKTGLRFDDEEALEILDGGGALIDKKSRIAKFPPYLVEDSVRSAPSKLLLAGRNPNHDFVMESNRVGFTNFGEGVFIIDPYTGEHRETTKADVAASALLADYLSEIDVYERAVGAGDVPQETVQLHNAEAWLPNTSKHGFMGPSLKWPLRSSVAKINYRNAPLFPLLPARSVRYRSLKRAVKLLWNRPGPA
jgi:trimethylamine--corrinoid protein Co-methyltransferase